MRAVTWVGRNLWITFLALVVGLVSPTLARDYPAERESLAGLTGVYVIVERVDPDAEQEGLDQSTLQTDVEVKLRQAGIRVLTKTEALVTPGAPNLHLMVDTMKLSGAALPIYAVSFHLELNQEVMLARKPTIALLAPTWSTSGIGAAGTKALHRMRENVRDLVDRFINAYLAANPKR